MTARDSQYPAADLVEAWIVKKGADVFHVADPAQPTLCRCSVALTGRIRVGFARQALRRGLRPCRATTDHLSAQEEE